MEQKNELLNYIFKASANLPSKINILYFINLPPSYLKNYNMQIILFISKLLEKSFNWFANSI
jgi:hypothetical protein